MADVQVRLRAAGVEPDAAAGRRFRAAACRLHESRPTSDAARQAQAEAALALLGLAAGGHTTEVATYLGPDPAVDQVTWTVVCYQIGDLSPSAVRDFADVTEALATLVRCDDPTHRAAELVGSTADGLHWTAVVRSGDQLAFQLPSEDTLRASDPDHVRDAVARWAAQLRRWAAGDEPAPEPSPRAAAAPTAPAAPGAVDERLDAVARTLALLASRVSTLVERPDAASAVDARLASVASHLKDLSDGLLAEALRHGLTVEAQVDRITQRVDHHGDRLHLQLAAIEARLPSAIEPRLDLLADRLDEVLDRLAALERAVHRRDA